MTRANKNSNKNENKEEVCNGQNGTGQFNHNRFYECNHNIVVRRLNEWDGWMKKTNTGNHDANKHVKNDLEINLPDKWRMASLRLCVFVSFFLACPLRMSRAQSVGLHEWTSSVVICEISLTRAREMCAHNYDNNNSPQCKMIIALESDKTPSMMLLLLLLSFFYIIWQISRLKCTVFV